VLIVASFFYTPWIFTAKDKTCLEPNYTLDIYLPKNMSGDRKFGWAVDRVSCCGAAKISCIAGARVEGNAG
jgi:hypothetical protein